ncbi:MAG: dephospho-CoA kinase [Clostridium sp.]|nr:dephospho-CoA kinase [Clostridium sp.]
MRLTAIAGGIGSGKSFVARIVASMGYPVYDCDSRAKQLMDHSDAIKRRIADEIDLESICRDGSIDRRRLSKVVFADAAALARLNGIVHGAVREDILRWVSGEETGGANRVFVETAILYESGLDRMVDDVWLVTAPEEVRVGRIVSRSGGAMTPSEARARIEAQRRTVTSTPHPHIELIPNDGVAPLLPRILELLR